METHTSSYKHDPDILRAGQQIRQEQILKKARKNISLDNWKLWFSCELRQNLHLFRHMAAWAYPGKVHNIAAFRTKDFPRPCPREATNYLQADHHVLGGAARAPTRRPW